MHSRKGRLLLRPTMLLLISQARTYGYQLVDRLRELGLTEIDSSLIYRALRMMEAHELIKSDWDQNASQGPPRRVYLITEKGNRFLEQKINELKTTRDQIDRLIEAYQKVRIEGDSTGKEK